MPGRSDGKTFIGPRILTRRQFIKGLGGGAATLGLGYMQACERQDMSTGKVAKRKDKDKDKDKRKDPRARIRNSMGNKAASYFDKQVTDPNVINYIDARAASFGSSCNLGGSSRGLPLTLLTSGHLPVLDIGGEFTNDQSFLAIINLKASPDFTQYFAEETGHKVKQDSVLAYFVTNRFVDPVASTGEGELLVGITDAAVVVVTDVNDGDENGDDNGHKKKHDGHGRKRRASIESYLVDCKGVQLLRRERLDRDEHPPTNALDKNPNIVSRESRVNAYFGQLVVNLDGQKLLLPYDPFDPVDSLPSGTPSRESFAGIEGVQYQHVDTSIPRDQYGEPSLPNDTGGPESFAGVWKEDPESGPGRDLQVQGYGLGISEDPPQPPPEVGYGDPDNYQPGDFTCFRFNEQDSCTGCCNDAGTAAQSLIWSSGLACVIASWGTICWVVPIIGNISCTIGCGAATAALSLAARYKESRCTDNCSKPYSK